MKINQKRKTATKTTQLSADDRRPFIEHLYELRKRLLYIVGSVFVVSILAYFIQEQLVDFILRPAKQQQFIYTSPGGGIGFLFQLCTYAGIIFSTPVIIYQVLQFLAPVIHKNVRKFIIRCSFFSAILAIIGFCFGYFIGLPIALHFLSHQFTTKQIHPLFSIQEYMSFVMIYLVGSVLLFQIPLVLMFINHIRPYNPRKLLKYERYVIVIAFIVAIIMAPTTNIFDQLIIAVPTILMYQLGIFLVWQQNRGKYRPKGVRDLLAIDQLHQQERRERLSSIVPIHPSILYDNFSLVQPAESQLEPIAPAPIEISSEHHKWLDIISQP
jgi:sec-independent protein translocase protein TatC